MSLTQDEYAVLMIAEKGESIAAIGRWEKPIQSLVARGLMRANDKFNNVITDAGRVAVEKEDDEAIRDVIQANNAIAANPSLAQTRQQVLPMGQQAADLLVAMVRASVGATGDSPETAARAWSEQILKLAVEKLKCG